jgi:hypothetical protein
MARGDGLRLTLGERIAFTVSLLLTCTGGGALILHYGLLRSTPKSAAVRALLYVAIMGAVHVAGFRFYKLQGTRPQKDHDGTLSDPVVDDALEFAGWHKSAQARVSIGVDDVRFAVILQIIFLFLTALMLDGGNLFRVCGIAVIAHWLIGGWILATRQSAATRLDRWIIRYGFPPLIVLVGALAPVVWRIIGTPPL